MMQINVQLGITSLLILTVFLFNSCSGDVNSEEDVAIAAINYGEVGDSLTNISQQVLLSNVGRELKAGGPINAINFCNINASSLMDSLSNEYGVEISRVTDKPRNRLNKASEFELSLLNTLMTSGAKDTVVDTKASVVYYKSILLGMPTCLKCHGTDNDIDEQTSEAIHSLYPGDRATDYQLGDFRGVWKVQFNSK